ncbi:MAG TPA: CsgG/HfaB family protein [Bacteroidota bacterium]|nr:CsgG/HfaB family protein [Bacteroidota bacterium]
MTRRLLYLFAATLLACGLLVNAQVKKRIAVADFQDKSGHRGAGQGVADMLVTALVKSGEFIVIERKELDKVLAEQRLGRSGNVTPQTAPAIGKLLGADLLVLGSISELGTKDRNVSGGAPLFGAKINAKTARAAVDIRLVSTTTGEIIAAETEEGTESTVGLGGRYQNYNFADFSQWNDTDIGKAAREAIDETVNLIAKNIVKVPWSGRIIKMSEDGTVIMKPGSEANVVADMEFDVFRPGEELKDPDTGLALGHEESKVGRIRVTEDMLAGKAARAKVLQGGGFQAGDFVREKKGD